MKTLLSKSAIAAAGLLLWSMPAQAQMKHGMKPDGAEISAAYDWIEVMLEASAREVERIGARPTILSRQMAIPATAMFDAWAAYDDKAVGTMYGGSLRRPADERTLENKEEAIAYAMYRTCVDQYPHFEDYLSSEMQRMGYDPGNTTMDTTTPAGIGNTVAQAIIEYRHHDGANQLGDESGSMGKPYSDYTMYRPVNTADEIIDPDRWQPIPFDDGKGGKVVPGFLTPHWYRVKPFGLESGGQFRPGPPPKVGDPQLKKEIDECIEFNATLDPEQKALVEFMRDGPRSTAQSGHWLRFALDVSIRDKHDLDADVPLFFAVANTAMDAFIASWEAKRYYDSSRPWTLVRHYYKGKDIMGWAGPGNGVVSMKGDNWHPYSPSTFITPPFPGYTSGHSTVSAGCAEMLRLMTGSDEFNVVEERVAGALTEEGAECEEMQRVNGVLPELAPGEELSCDVALDIPTFTEAAEMAGISRVMGGYHIQADNIAGLELGREVAAYLYPKVQSYVDGTAEPILKKM